jgi:hypothetical protein
MTSHLMNAGMALQEFSAVAEPQTVGVGFSLNDVARFEAMMTGGVAPTARADAAEVSRPFSILSSDAMKAFFDPLGRINNVPEKLLAISERAATNPEFTPGDMITSMVTVQKFVFECQLTSSVANRTSDGVQELFRQQA